MKEWVGRVRGNEPRGSGYHVLTFDLPARFPVPKAGAFLMLSAGAEPQILLRRPMAFYDVVRKTTRTEVSVLYSVVGRGTEQMRRLAPGREISLLAPLGNSFSQPKTNEQIAIVAGGVGIAPFLLWARQLEPKKRKNVHTLFGFRNRAQLPILKDFERQHLNVKSAIEGTGGDIRGTVVDLLERELKAFRFNRILTCGPEKMMERVVEIAKRENIPCEVSLEAKMGCGLGVCLSCVTDFAPGTRPGGYSLVCQDGPIFTATR